MRIIPLHFKLRGNNCEEEEVAETVEIALGLVLPLVNSAPSASFRLFSILFCFLAASLSFFYSSSNLLGSCAFFRKDFSAGVSLQWSLRCRPGLATFYPRLISFVSVCFFAKSEAE